MPSALHVTAFDTSPPHRTARAGLVRAQRAFRRDAPFAKIGCYMRCRLRDVFASYTAGSVSRQQVERRVDGNGHISTSYEHAGLGLVQRQSLSLPLRGNGR